MVCVSSRIGSDSQQSEEKQTDGGMSVKVILQ